MKNLLIACVLGLVGCASSNYNNISKPPIVPENKAVNTFQMPEHGIVTEQDVHNIPEHSNVNYQYKADF